MMEKEVSVFVPVYNHRNYIKQTLDSILIQKVTFPYEIVIMMMLRLMEQLKL